MGVAGTLPELSEWNLLFNRTIKDALIANISIVNAI